MKEKNSLTREISFVCPHATPPLSNSTEKRTVHCILKIQNGKSSDIVCVCSDSGASCPMGDPIKSRAIQIGLKHRTSVIKTVA